MNLGTFAGFLTTLVLGIITTYFIVTSNLDKTITDKIQEPNFTKKIIEQVRIPFLIFDENKTYVMDGGAANFIKDIEIIKSGREITKIILTLNKNIPVAPILVNLNNDVQFFQGTRYRETGWEYKALQFATTWVNTPSEEPPPKLFKLDILDLK